jgi:hypothetical protein
MSKPKTPVSSPTPARHGGSDAGRPVSAAALRADRAEFRKTQEMSGQASRAFMATLKKRKPGA